MTDGIIIGIGSTVGAVILLGLVALVARQWKSPKRLDRLDDIVPALTRGVWALLSIHIAEINGETDPEVKKAYDALGEVVFPAVVSRKAGK